ncbi:TetR/AcrR family transcriptional regulator [Clostridium sp. HV4-5-A1G]|uniref:TetR/AcrR family transcriptional regulator n=1 Tax=Clostridium sp. HV4-5-A1G TaxID=2004595 RepID=UPI0012389F40|nr:TetR/AcrR family transcriptional regulator [Clostridium sp. HV4-5-A1G]KAA8677539.1 TetR/AcrR family transcriptional regulator [Clostridium sp. HV4-5-A1G]CAB1246529.1 Transcriptional regulator, TetR family [Clostridiaceae bacterium BL-3]
MNKKDIKKYRNMSYFIDAAARIIDEEGIEFVTIRKVSDLAGYNSATLYHYFKNLDELILFASIKHLKEYTLNLEKYIESAKGSIEIYYKIWECFCKYSFLNPQIYNNIFFGKHNDSIPHIIQEYYSIFPEELSGNSKELLPMLLGSDLYTRNLVLLSKIQSDGYLNESDLDDVNEMTILLYHGMLIKVLNSENQLKIEDILPKTLRYIKQILNSFIIKKEN